jgi:hypothetical protein
VLSVISLANERFESSYERKRLGYVLHRVAEKVAWIYEIDLDDIFTKVVREPAQMPGAYFATGVQASWACL